MRDDQTHTTCSSDRDRQVPGGGNRDVAPRTPRVVLICESGDPVDTVGLASWLAHSMQLVGMVAIHDRPIRRWRALCREQRRGGWRAVADLVAFRADHACLASRRDGQWLKRTVRELREAFPADLDRVPRLDVDDPNNETTRHFIGNLAPDVVVARCKRLLIPPVFEIPRAGTFVLHPGVCPEYRNAHGCFWALANRDLTRVGMTMLRIDAGVDTGPAFLHASYPFDEVRETHRVIQYRVVLENLPAIGRVLDDVVAGRAVPIDTRGRRSGVWGQPRLSAYWRWKRAARRERYGSAHFPAVS